MFKNWWNNKLLKAVKAGDLSLVKQAQGKGADLNYVPHCNDCYMHCRCGEGSALVIAIKYGHDDIIDYLLDEGVELDTHAPWGETALSHAVLYSEDDILLQRLLDHGADPNFGGEDGKTPLTITAIKGMTKTAKLLIKSGADVNQLHNYLHRDTALMVAATHGHVGMIGLLVSAGADIDAHNHWDKSAILLAAANKKLDCVTKLVELGANESELPFSYRQKHKKEIQAAKFKHLQSSASYDVINDHTVIKHEGKIKGVGSLYKIFDFHAKTVTDVANDVPGTPTPFEQFNTNRDFILKALKKLPNKGRNTEHPFIKTKRHIGKRPS